MSRPQRLLAGALLLLAGGAGAAPPCRVSVELEPPVAYPGQQVLHRMRIERREDAETVEWIRAPSFPGLRAEYLAMRSENSMPGGLRLRHENRALFAERPGTLSLPPALLRCRTAHGSFDTHVPGAVLRVRELPVAGRPPDFSGLVGPLELRRRVVPERPALGESLELRVLLRGPGNLWLAADPLPELPVLAGAELFRLPAELELHRGERLMLSRHFRYQVVPRRQGTLRLPALRLPFFDPGQGRYAQVVVPAVEIPVGPPRSPPAAAPPTSAPQRARGAADGLLRAAWLWTSLKLALLVAAALVFLCVRRRVLR